MVYILYNIIPTAQKKWHGSPKEDSLWSSNPVEVLTELPWRSAFSRFPFSIRLQTRSTTNSHPGCSMGLHGSACGGSGHAMVVAQGLRNPWHCHCHEDD